MGPEADLPPHYAVVRIILIRGDAKRRNRAPQLHKWLKDLALFGIIDVEQRE
jgi:hypothetical protein